MTTTSRSLTPLTRPHAAVLAARSWLLAGLGLLLAVPLAARARLPERDAGMSTAEYAVGTVAAVAFAAVLYKVVRSGAVSSALSSIIQGALGISL